MDLITPDTVADHYLAAHDRVVSLVTGLDGERASTTVPATPKWTVHDLVAHLTAIPSDIATGRLTGIPNDEQTQEQVAARRDRSIDELLEEWASGLDLVVDAARAGLIPAPLAIDAITHEQDLRGALGAQRVPDEAAIRFGAIGFSYGLRHRVDGAGLPPLRLRATDGDLDVTAGKGEARASVAAPVFDLFRAMAGRRSRAQVAQFDWQGEVDRYLDCFCVFGPLAESDISD